MSFSTHIDAAERATTSGKTKYGQREHDEEAPQPGLGSLLRGISSSAETTIPTTEAARNQNNSHLTLPSWLGGFSADGAASDPTTTAREKRDDKYRNSDDDRHIGTRAKTPEEVGIAATDYNEVIFAGEPIVVEMTSTAERLKKGNEEDKEAEDAFQEEMTFCFKMPKFDTEELKAKIIDAAMPESASGIVDKTDLTKSGLGISFTLFYQAVFFATFFALFVTAYLSQLGSSFLSPLDSDSAGATCSQVPIQINARFRMDTEGNWEGSSKFQANLAVYDVSFQSVTLNPNAYANLMTDFKARMLALEQKALDRDISWTLAVGSGYIKKYTFDQGTVEFYFTYDATTVYDQTITNFGVSSGKGEFCSLTGTMATYDKTTSSLSLSIPVLTKPVSPSVPGGSASNGSGSSASTGGALIEPCDPYVFSLTADVGYDVNNAVDNSSFAEVAFDIRSITTALLVNNKIITIADLELVTSLSSWNFDEKNFFNLYRSSFYPDMEPIICYNLNSTYATGPHFQGRSTGYDTCIVIMGSNQYYPFTAHAGYKSGVTNVSSNVFFNWCWNNYLECTQGPANPPPSYYYYYGSPYDYMLKETCDNYDVFIGLHSFPNMYNWQPPVNATGTGTDFFGYYESLNEIIHLHDDGDLNVSSRAFQVMEMTADISRFNGWGAISFIDGTFEAILNAALMSKNKTASPTASPTIASPSPTAPPTRSTIDSPTQAPTQEPTSEAYYAYYGPYKWWQEGYRHFWAGGDQCPSTYQEGLQAVYTNLMCEDCSVITFQITKKVASSSTSGVNSFLQHLITNRDYREVYNSSYNNDFYFETALNTMITTPPTLLVQAFLVCHTSSTTAFQSSVGTSWANTQVLAAFTVFFFLNLLKQVYNRIFVKKVQNKAMLISSDRRIELHRQVLTALVEELAMDASPLARERCNDLLVGLKRTMFDEHVTSGIIRKQLQMFKIIERAENPMQNNAIVPPIESADEEGSALLDTLLTGDSIRTTRATV